MSVSQQECYAACPLQVGEVVEVLPGYAPLTVNLHEVYHMVQNGLVVDIWPILARGSGRGEVWT